MSTPTYVMSSDDQSKLAVMQTYATGYDWLRSDRIVKNDLRSPAGHSLRERLGYGKPARLTAITPIHKNIPVAAKLRASLNAGLDGYPTFQARDTGPARRVQGELDFI
jgi:hypothetical protein